MLLRHRESEFRGRLGEVIIYDYADMRVPVLARMAAKRQVSYQAIGYHVLDARDLLSDRAVMPNEPA
jgi:hypothetical protein